MQDTYARCYAISRQQRKAIESAGAWLRKVTNVVYKRLRDRRYQVYAVNPNADQVEGDRSYHSLKTSPAASTRSVIATRPEVAAATMSESAELGINQVWMPRVGAGSVSREATSYGWEHGITVIDAGCPLMSKPTADIGHKIMRGLATRRVGAARSEFAGFRFPPEVITLAVRWYVRYWLSYRDVEELLAERGIEVDHTTLFRWVMRFTPLFIEAARPSGTRLGTGGSSTKRM